MKPFEKYNFFRLSFIDDNIENVLYNFKSYLSEIDNDFVSEEHSQIDFDLIRSHNGSFNFMIFESINNPNKTVFYCDISDGWFTAVYNYARLFKKEIYQIGLTISIDKINPAYFFYRFAYNDKGDFEQRAVQLIKENRWVFYENSEKVQPLAIENMENYSLKRKIDRLNKEIILDYMQKVGFNLNDLDFFKTNKPVYHCRWH